MRKLPIYNSHEEVQLPPDAILGAVWQWSNQDPTEFYKYQLVHEAEGFLFRRDFGKLTSGRSTAEIVVFEAQHCDAPTAVFEFSCQQELEEWLTTPMSEFCPVCAQAPCGCAETGGHQRVRNRN